MAEDEAEREEYVSRGSSGRQVRKRRRDGWTLRRRTLFLDHLRVTSNVRASARAAGMTETTAYKLRARDPEFASRWDEALKEAEVRLTSRLIVLAETGGKAVPEREDGEPAEAPIEHFDKELALRLLALNRRSQAAKRHPAPAAKSASREELVEIGVKLLGKIKRERARLAAA